MFLPLTVTLVSAPGLRVFLVASSSFFTWATASIMPLKKRALSRIRFISDVALSLGSIQRAQRLPPQGLQVKLEACRKGKRGLFHVAAIKERAANHRLPSVTDSNITATARCRCTPGSIPGRG